MMTRYVRLETERLFREPVNINVKSPPLAFMHDPSYIT